MKKQNRIIALFTALTVSLVMGINANAQSRDYGFKGFNQIKVSGNMNVIYTQGKQYQVKMEGPQKLLDEYIAEKKGQTLVCKPIKESGKKKTDKDSKQLKLYVSAPELNAINISGVSRFDTDKLNAEELDLTLAGVCAAHIKTLKADDLEINCSGVSKFHIGQTNAEDVEINCSGVSTGEMNMTGEELTASISGTSQLELKVNCQELSISASGVSSVTVSGTATSKNLKSSGVSKIHSQNLK